MRSCARERSKLSLALLLMESLRDPCIVLFRSCSIAGEDVRRPEDDGPLATDGRLDMLSRSRGWDWDWD